MDPHFGPLGLSGHQIPGLHFGLFGTCQQLEILLLTSGNLTPLSVNLVSHWTMSLLLLLISTAPTMCPCLLTFTATAILVHCLVIARLSYCCPLYACLRTALLSCLPGLHRMLCSTLYWRYIPKFDHISSPILYA